MNKELIEKINKANDYEAFCLLREDFNSRKEEIYKKAFENNKKAFENSKKELKGNTNFVDTMKKWFYEITHIEIIF